MNRSITAWIPFFVIVMASMAPNVEKVRSGLTHTTTKRSIERLTVS